jgi:hypothetical protein
MGFARAYRTGDAEDLAVRLRSADLAELRAGSEDSPLDILRKSAEMSAPACTIIGNLGFVAGMFGVVGEGTFGRVWLLGSDELVQRPLVKQFLKECPTFLSVMARPYERIGNVVLAANTVHVRWLKFMGFTFTGGKASGINGEEFLEFERGNFEAVPVSSIKKEPQESS